MLDKIAAYIAKHALLQTGDRVGVACSGGVDSIVLLRSLHALGYAVEAAHMNYGLRGPESDADQVLVEATCKELGAICHVEKVQVPKEANIQLAARDMRYAWLAELKLERGWHAVATGHQADDHLETLVFRFMRGTGSAGLAGIPVRNGDIIRPLRGERRMDVVGFAQMQGWTWREDTSNATDAYARNDIRHNILPLMLQRNPAMVDSWVESSQMFEATKHYLQSQADAHEGLHIFWKSEDLQPHHPVLWILLQRRGFSSALMDQVVRLSQAQSGAQVQSATHQVVAYGGGVWISPVKTPAFEVKVLRSWEDLEQVFGVVQSSEVPNPPVSDADTFLGDADVMPFPLWWRPWKTGDRIRPIGMQGSQLISDVLTQAKVPAHFKQEIGVLATRDQVVWVPGFKRSNVALISKNTQKACWINHFGNPALIV